MPTPSRRAILGGTVLIAGAAVGAGLGVQHPIRHKVAIAPPPAPTVLTTALQAHQSLSTTCTQLLATNDPTAAALMPLGRDLAAHIAALLAVLQAYPAWRLAESGTSAVADTPTSGTPNPPATSLAELRSGLKVQALALANGCQLWRAEQGQASTVVPLLASISVCLSVHTGRLA